MGDVKTHFGVTSFVRDQLQKNLPQGTLVAKDYTYLELGNYLTDVSQFRDPPAHHKARDEIWRMALVTAMGKLPIPILSIFGALFALLAGVTAWTDKLMGEDEPGKRHGALAQFFLHVVRAVTHQSFADDGLASSMGSTPLQGLTPIPAAEVDRVFDKAFTQYWPHEHLDFPPSKDLEDHREESMFRVGSKGVIEYLRRHTHFVAQELSKVEVDLVKAMKAGGNEQNRHDALVKLGNLLHPVEDFFFHSNFVEMRQWQHVRRKNPGLDERTAEGRKKLAQRGLAGLPQPSNPRRDRRVLFRRLRYPVFDDDTPSDESSVSGTDTLYTGGFGKTDIFHTIGSALETFEEKVVSVGKEADKHKSVSPKAAAIAKGTKNLRNHELILIRLVFNEDERRKMVKNGLATEHAELHAKQLKDGKYRKLFQKLKADKRISARAEQEFQKAFALDEEVENEWSFFPGIGGILIQILDELERTRMSAASAAAALDSKDESVYDERTKVELSGGKVASSEIIGTHSLMAKDSPDKGPLRADAEALARHASASVATALFRRVAQNKSQQVGVDWDSVLRFFIRKPRPTGGGWYNEIRHRLRKQGTSFSQPDIGTVKSRPPQNLLGPSAGLKKLQALRAGDAKKKLEDHYRSFED